MKLFDTSLAILYCRSQPKTTKATIGRWIALSELGLLVLGPDPGHVRGPWVVNCSVRVVGQVDEPLKLIISNTVPRNMA